MTTHTQWIEVHSDGAAPSTGWRCDGCGQVKWQDEAPDEACDICAEAAPERETLPGTGQAPAAEPESPKPASRRSRGAGGPSNPERTQ